MVEYQQIEPFGFSTTRYEEGGRPSCDLTNKKLGVLALAHSSNMAGAQLALSSLIRNTSEDIRWSVVAPREGPFVDSVCEYARVQVVPYPWWCRGKDYVPPVMSTDNIDILNATLDDYDFDIALSNTLTVPWLAYYSRMLEIPHIWYVHEYGDRDHGLVFPYGYNKCIEYINAFSDTVMTVSDSVARHLSANGLDEQKIVLINQSFDSEHFLSIPEISQSNSLLTMGAVKESKGQLDALVAFSRSALVRTHSLTIAGPVTEPRYADEILNYINKEKLSEKVLFKPRRVEGSKEMMSSSGVLVCSRDEALGRVTLEALAAGRVVVGRDSGGTAALLANKRGITYDGTIDDLVEKLDNLELYSSQLSPVGERKNFIKTNYTPEKEREGLIHAIEHALQAAQSRGWAQVVAKTGLINALRRDAIIN